MENRWSPRKEKFSFLASVNFFLLLVILFCVNYLYIEFLFK